MTVMSTGGFSQSRVLWIVNAFVGGCERRWKCCRLCCRIKFSSSRPVLWTSDKHLLACVNRFMLKLNGDLQLIRGETIVFMAWRSHCKNINSWSLKYLHCRRLPVNAKRILVDTTSSGMNCKRKSCEGHKLSFTKRRISQCVLWIIVLCLYTHVNKTIIADNSIEELFPLRLRPVIDDGRPKAISHN